MLLLQTRGKMTAQQLADETNVSRRTILRDISPIALLVTLHTHTVLLAILLATMFVILPAVVR